MTKKRIIALLVVSQLIMVIIFVFTYTYLIKQNKPMLNEVIFGNSYVDGRYVSSNEICNIPYLESKNEDLNTYLDYANFTLQSRICYYAYYHGSDLTLQYSVKRQGLHVYVFTVTGTYSDEDLSIHDINEIIVIDTKGIYRGKEASISINDSQLGGFVQ